MDQDTERTIGAAADVIDIELVEVDGSNGFATRFGDNEIVKIPTPRAFSETGAALMRLGMPESATVRFWLNGVPKGKHSLKALGEHALQQASPGGSHRERSRKPPRERNERAFSRNKALAQEQSRARLRDGESPIGDGLRSNRRNWYAKHPEARLASV